MQQYYYLIEVDSSQSQSNFSDLPLPSFTPQ